MQPSVVAALTAAQPQSAPGQTAVGRLWRARAASVPVRNEAVPFGRAASALVRPRLRRGRWVVDCCRPQSQLDSSSRARVTDTSLRTRIYGEIVRVGESRHAEDRPSATCGGSLPRRPGPPRRSETAAVLEDGRRRTVETARGRWQPSDQLQRLAACATSCRTVSRQRLGHGGHAT